MTTARCDCSLILNLPIKYSNELSHSVVAVSVVDNFNGLEFWADMILAAVICRFETKVRLLIANKRWLLYCKLALGEVLTPLELPLKPERVVCMVRLPANDW